MNNRFSPEFAEKLKRKIGDPAVFKKQYEDYLSWRFHFRPEVISPFCGRFVCPHRFDNANCPQECYDDPALLVSAAWDEEAPSRIAAMEREYLRVSDYVARNAMRDPLHHPTASEIELVQHLRRRWDEEVRQMQRRQRDARVAQRRAYEELSYERDICFRPDPER